MEVVKNIVVTLVVLMLVAAILSVSVFIYEYRFEKKEVYREGSPNGEYHFILYQVGQPEWPFGPVKAEIRALNTKGKTIDKESIVIHTDGGQLHETYIDEICWGDNMIEVVCSGEDGTASYVLELEE
ncbi:MAG: hypothetical protein IJ012_06580 [Clostridia bacterium]|nr:hypothetical protein [Clostridia bacterium]